jgi:hypothetical protein
MHTYEVFISLVAGYENFAVFLAYIEMCVYKNIVYVEDSSLLGC